MCDELLFGDYNDEDTSPFPHIHCVRDVMFDGSDYPLPTALSGNRDEHEENTQESMHTHAQTQMTAIEDVVDIVMRQWRVPTWYAIHLCREVIDRLRTMSGCDDQAAAYKMLLGLDRNIESLVRLHMVEETLRAVDVIKEMGLQHLVQIPGWLCEPVVDVIGCNGTHCYGPAGCTDLVLHVKIACVPDDGQTKQVHLLKVLVMFRQTWSDQVDDCGVRHLSDVSMVQSGLQIADVVMRKRVTSDSESDGSDDDGDSNANANSKRNSICDVRQTLVQSIANFTSRRFPWITHSDILRVMQVQFVMLVEPRLF